LERSRGSFAIRSIFLSTTSGPFGQRALSGATEASRGLSSFHLSDNAAALAGVLDGIFENEAAYIRVTLAAVQMMLKAIVTIDTPRLDRS
jgi:hypothetical protein